MSITTTKKPTLTPQLLQLPQNNLESKVLTMLDLFDTQLALVDRRAHDRYVTATTKTALHYNVSTETMRGARLLFLSLRFYRNGASMVPYKNWDKGLVKQADEFFKTHELRAT